MIDGLYIVLDPTHDRYTITAFTNEKGRNKLIGAVCIRPQLTFSLDSIDVHFKEIKNAIQEVLDHIGSNEYDCVITI